MGTLFPCIKAGEGYFSPLMHEDFVPHASKGLCSLLRREKATSPANAWELCSSCIKGTQFPLRREKASSPANACGLCSTCIKRRRCLFRRVSVLGCLLWTCNFYK